MDNNYLDKKLKGILESAPDLPPDPAAMLDMQRRLRDLRSGRRGGAWLPYAGALLLLLLLTGFGFFYRTYDQLNAQVQELNHQLTQQLRSDTIIEKQIIYRIDTIYQVIYEKQPVSGPLAAMGTAFSNSNPPPTLSFSSRYGPGLGSLIYKDLGWSLWGTPNSLLAVGTGSSFFKSAAIPATQKLLEEPASFSDLLEPVASLSIPSVSVAHSATQPSLHDQLNYDFVSVRKNTIHPLYYFVPIGLRAGINASSGGITGVKAEGIPYTFGIRGGIVLPQNRELELGGEFWGMNFESRDPDSFGGAFPVEPREPSDEVHEIKGNLNYLQIRAGIRQRLLAGRKFQPFLSSGVVAHKLLQQRLVYEFTGAAGEYYLEAEQPSGDFSLHHLWVGLGMEYALGKRWSLGSAVNYQYNFSKTSDDYFRLQYWSFRLGINYNFSVK
jgi:hypothetical protein